MTVRMSFPPFVTRAAMRIALGGLVAAAAIAVAALVIERTAAGRRPGGVARPPQGRGGRRIRRARRPARSGRARRDARCRDAAPRGARRRAARSGSCSTRWRPARARDRRRGHHLRRRQPAGRVARAIRRRARRAPLRPGVIIPRAEQPGPAAGPRPTDLRSGRARRDHIGAIVAEAPAAAHRQTPSLPGSEFSLETSIVPVALQAAVRRRVGCRSRCVRDPLADERAARGGDRVRRRPAAARASAFAIACLPRSSRSAALLLLLLTGPLLDWRRLTQSAGRGHVLTLSIAALLLLRARSSGSRFARPGSPSFRCCPSAPWTRFAQHRVRVADRFLPERAASWPGWSRWR